MLRNPLDADIPMVDNDGNQAGTIKRDDQDMANSFIDLLPITNGYKVIPITSDDLKDLYNDLVGKGFSVKLEINYPHQ